MRAGTRIIEVNGKWQIQIEQGTRWVTYGTYPSREEAEWNAR